MGDIIGTAIGIGLGAYGKKPKVPTWQTISPAKSQQEAINADITAQPAAQRLAASENLFNFDQLQGMLEKAIPFYQSLKAQTSSDIGSLLKGEIPGDVAGQIQRSDAAKALSGGYAGTPMHGSLLARDLGTTSLALTDRGISAAEQWLSTASAQTPRLFDASSMFINPQQMFSDQASQQSSQFSRDWLGARVESLPEPWAAALGQAFQGEGSSIASLAGSALGYGGGTGGGGGGSGGGGSSL